VKTVGKILYLQEILLVHVTCRLLFIFLQSVSLRFIWLLPHSSMTSKFDGNPLTVNGLHDVITLYISLFNLHINGIIKLLSGRMSLKVHSRYCKYKDEMNKKM
jgi:hypothetical protein